MPMLRAVTATLLLGLAACGGAEPGATPPAVVATPTRPNLLLVSLDTVRWDHTSLAGYTRDTTPALGELAALPGATTFERAYAPAAWSLPAYASLLTGRDALSHGVGFQRSALEPGHTTITEALAAHGYATAAFTSGPHLIPETALGRGFATHEHITAASPMTPAVSGALGWLDTHDADEPFFLMVVGYDAHTPYTAPSAFAELYDPGYRGFLHQADNPLRDDPCALRGDTRTCLRFFPERFADPSDAGADLDAPRLLVEPNLDWVKLPGGTRVELRRQRDLQAAVRALLDAHAQGGTATVAPAALERLQATELGPLLLEGPRLDPRTVLVPASLSQGGFDAPDTAHLVAHYDAAIRAADLQLGRLLQVVEQRGLLDSTIVVVLADHGEALGEEIRFHHDDQVGDSVFHVPLVVHQPGAGRTARWDRPVSLVGLTPTLLELLEIPLPAGTGAYGFTGALVDGTAPPEEQPVIGASLCCYWVRDADWELQGHRVEGAEPGTPLVWSLFRDGQGPDLAADQPERVEAMRRHIAHWPAHPGRFARFGLGEKDGDDPALRQALREGGYWAPEPQEGSP
jgi:arylsulfatase A-like enzyme